MNANMAPDGAWGVTISDLSVERKSRFGETSFRLDIDGALHVRAGAGPDGVNRLPVMGQSGAGKSTLLNLLNCTSFPRSPRAKVNWIFPDGYTTSWGQAGPGRSTLVKLRQKYFGYAFQTASLQPQLTIGENLTFSLENTGTSHKVAVDKALEALTHIFHGDADRAGNIMHRYDTEVSGGERQRISLLQAMIRDPYVLFADEPTGSLDKNTRHHVMGILTDWVDEAPDRRMVIWVTHHETDPQDNGADRRLSVRDGGVTWQRLVDGEWVLDGVPEKAAEETHAGA